MWITQKTIQQDYSIYIALVIYLFTYLKGNKGKEDEVGMTEEARHTDTVVGKGWGEQALIRKGQGLNPGTLVWHMGLTCGDFMLP